MKPNFETGNVDMSDEEFVDLLGSIHWINTGTSIQSLHDLKRAKTDFILGTIAHDDDDKLSVAAAFDVLPTWTLGKAATEYALDRLSLISGVLAGTIRYNRDANEEETGDRFYKFTDHGLGPISVCERVYLDLLDSAMELEAHQNDSN